MHGQPNQPLISILYSYSGFRWPNHQKTAQLIGSKQQTKKRNPLSPVFCCYLFLNKIQGGPKNGTKFMAP